MPEPLKPSTNLYDLACQKKLVGPLKRIPFVPGKALPGDFWVRTIVTPHKVSSLHVVTAGVPQEPPASEDGVTWTLACKRLVRRGQTVEATCPSGSLLDVEELLSFQIDTPG